MTTLEVVLCAVWVLSNLLVVLSNEALAATIRKNLESNKRVIEAIKKS